MARPLPYLMAMKRHTSPINAGARFDFIFVLISLAFFIIGFSGLAGEAAPIAKLLGGIFLVIALWSRKQVKPVTVPQTMRTGPGCSVQDRPTNFTSRSF